MNDLIQNEFEFLVDQHAFKASKLDDAVLYQSESLVLIPAYDERDGFDTRLAFPGNGPQEISLGTILSSLYKDKATSFSSWTDTMDFQASFIKTHLERLVDAPRGIYDDFCGLQAWNAGSQGDEWGSTIVINANAINEENARLARIKSYFEG